MDGTRGQGIKGLGLPRVEAEHSGGLAAQWAWKLVAHVRLEMAARPAKWIEAQKGLE